MSATTPFALFVKVHRHPVYNIASLAKRLNGATNCAGKTYDYDRFSWSYAREFVPLDVPPNCSLSEKAPESGEACCGTPDERIKMAMQYWFRWNLICDKFADYAFQIETNALEDIATAMTTRCRPPCSVSLPDHPWEKIAAAPPLSHSGLQLHSDVNARWPHFSRIHPPLAETIERLAQLYGYSLGDVTSTIPSTRNATTNSMVTTVVADGTTMATLLFAYAYSFLLVGSAFVCVVGATCRQKCSSLSKHLPEV